MDLGAQLLRGAPFHCILGLLLLNLLKGHLQGDMQHTRHTSL
jgi:hypothetical protein